MPELPEVQTIVADLKPRLEGRKIAGITVLWRPTIAQPQVEELTERLIGQRIERVWRRGKYVVMDLSSDDRLVLHLRMTGRLLFRDRSAPEDRFTRVVIHLDGEQQLRFADARKFGRIRLLDDEQFRRLSASLGPEPLSGDFTLDWLTEVLARRGQRIKSVLLDQRYLVGLGNIYVDEALFEAGINPTRPANTLNDDEVERLFHAIRKALSSGIADRGTSFDSYLDAFGEPGQHQYRLQVYRRKGAACPRCGTPIERTVVGGRGTHFCPRCQPVTPSRASETVLPSRKAQQPQG
ncbi:MAG: bifunctional DNA-formamidopyrimidine glycosylase/DNA-(apurinic or apyrimidinic site) lyase [Chloroflexi bacterium]|nr:bifunctional DNA-formamidopyrimidine glycosylase/DNA-(apurinic or apyrimidinic site) lyase [Chloroflexota bacterium]